jgi:hypothetical protein
VPDQRPVEALAREPFVTRDRNVLRRCTPSKTRPINADREPGLHPVRSLDGERRCHAFGEVGLDLAIVLSLGDVAE